ncbi:hypothetical protein Tsubulata_025102 [Turnera subulata]|uniref:Receptor-like serine/threonine-protein kinase n=1 Tax=Turnera subulata TaxID=218843 RepID=A0A9Q0GCJ1_9ROSI|nr:hypothetical protein Tsubulata_025102 [Turnera subulata]
MASLLFLLFLLSTLSSPILSSSLDSLIVDSSLSVENTEDVLASPGGVFSAGFFPVGDNAYIFSIWFTETHCSNNCTVVWTANRDRPVNGKNSKLSLLKSGNLVLSDGGRLVAWSTGAVSRCTAKLSLLDNGNLVLYCKEGLVVWQSFDFPTDTLLPGQPLSKDEHLVSSRSHANYSSGFYKFYFDTDNILRLLYDGPEASSIYWPELYLLSWEAGRFAYNRTRVAVLDSLGNFSSSDGFTFTAADYGTRVQRRLKLDVDGNLRLYSRADRGKKWIVSWQVMSEPCRIHGICGPNSVCSYVASSGRRCNCLPGFKIKDLSDWSMGCDPEFNLSCAAAEVRFLKLKNVEFYGYDYGFYPNYTLEMCENLCLHLCNCKGFQFKFIKHNYPSNIPYCYPKMALLNGHHFPQFEGDIYVKVPKSGIFSNITVDKLDCSSQIVEQLYRSYPKSHENGSLRFILWFSCAFGIVEFFVIFLVWFCLIRTRQNSGMQGYSPITTQFRRFTLSELEKVTRGFGEEIGRGAGGIVYKGILPDRRVAAIKRLNVANQGEAEFQAEVSTIGKLNHMNLIDLWGYCAEGKHRLLVYEYMEHGSLAENLTSNAVDFEKRFNIAVGAAKGLAYLHEECLEFYIPQNILLDGNYQPKVSDFGLSQPLKIGSRHLNPRFSRIRGTRGYMAPEWISNQSITSKVDVYSYGMVLLGMATGKCPAEETQDKMMVPWMREKFNSENATDSWMEKIVDPRLEGKFDKRKMEVLIGVALECVKLDKDERPIMSQVVELLLQHEKYPECVS